MVRYPARAALALAYLKRRYNDYDVYVEDTANANMWLLFLRNLLPRGARLTSVNMLGGRENVVAACRVVQKKKLKRTIYIIDGDFDFLNDKRKLRLKYLYRIRGYCVENIILSGKSAERIAMSSSPNKSEADISRELAYANWMSHMESALTPLFAMYAAANRLCPDVQTVGYSVHRLFEMVNGVPEICTSKVRRRLFHLARVITSKVGFPSLREVLKRMRLRLKKLSVEMVISGKDYLFPHLHLMLKKKMNFMGTIETLKARFAELADASNEPWLARRIRAI